MIAGEQTPLIPALAAAGLTLGATTCWFCSRRASSRAETLFVGRLGVLGPELYLVGKRVRRLPGPRQRDGQASSGTLPPMALSFAQRILAEVMHCRPATQLALSFAAAQLEPLPSDGFVLPESDVEAWLDNRH